MVDSNSDESTAGPAIARYQALPVGVVVERRRASNRWASELWQPVAVVVGRSTMTAWSVMREAADATTYFAGVHWIELVPSEAPSYRQNLMTERPSIYVVLRMDSAQPVGVVVAQVTASPTDAEAYMVSGVEVVEPVPMPTEIADWLQAYVDAHHVEERFHKRKRQRHPVESGDGSRPRHRESE